MATRKFTQAAPAAPVNDSSKIVHSKNAVFALSLHALSEIETEQTELFCLACAGEKFGTQDAEVERSLFRMIQRIAGSIGAINALREHIETLAQHAGIAVGDQS